MAISLTSLPNAFTTTADDSTIETQFFDEVNNENMLEEARFVLQNRHFMEERENFRDLQMDKLKYVIMNYGYETKKKPKTIDELNKQCQDE